MFLGENIRFLRKKKGYSQEYVANKLGYKSFTTIQKWETGISEPPLKKLKELSILFGVDIDDMNNKKLSLANEMDFTTQAANSPYNPNEQQLIGIYGELAISAFNLYLQLDSDDQGEIRGEMKQMLKAKKYSIQKELRNA